MWAVEFFEHHPAFLVPLALACFFTALRLAGNRLERQTKEFYEKHINK